MHWTLIVIGCLVAWALLGGLWRRGSIALAGQWMAGQAFWTATGNNLPIALYWVTDPLVIYALWRWHGSRLDGAIMALFPVAWGAYLTTTGASQWWLLWQIACLQMFLAGPLPQAMTALATYSHGPLRPRRNP